MARRKGFTKVTNDIITDTRISAGAFRLFAYIASKPPGWVYIMDVMRGELGMGRNTIYDCINELLKCGYIERGQSRTPDGHFGAVEYTVSQKMVSRNSVSRSTVSRKSGHINNTDINNTDINKNELSSAPPQAADDGEHTLDYFRTEVQKAAKTVPVTKQMLRAFEAYWTQETDSGKMLFQVTRPFAFVNRLKLWKEHERVI